MSSSLIIFYLLTIYIYATVAMMLYSSFVFTYMGAVLAQPSGSGPLCLQI